MDIYQKGIKIKLRAIDLIPSFESCKSFIIDILKNIRQLSISCKGYLFCIRPVERELAKLETFFKSWFCVSQPNKRDLSSVEVEVIHVQRVCIRLVAWFKH